jgi:hypothetical protein
LNVGEARRGPVLRGPGRGISARVEPAGIICWSPAGFIPGGPGINLGEVGTQSSGFGPPHGLVLEILQAFLLLITLCYAVNQVFWEGIMATLEECPISKRRLSGQAPRIVGVPGQPYLQRVDCASANDPFKRQRGGAARRLLISEGIFAPAAAISKDPKDNNCSG